MSSSPEHPDAGSTGRPGHDELGEVTRQLIEGLSLGLVVFSHKLEVIYHNATAAFLVGDHASVVDALQTCTVDAQHQDWRAALQGVVTDGHERRFDHVLYCDSDQGERLLHVLCAPLRGTGGSMSGGTLVVEDVTAAVSMEKRLAVSERMAAVGKLAARVAHELNNPLDGILRYLNLAIRAVEIDKVEKVPEYLKAGRAGLMRMAEIVRDLVEFSRSTATAFDDAGINTIVEEAVKVMSDKAVASRVSTVCTLSEGMPAIRGTNLFQVFCNLIKNAVDAMPQGGTLTIVTQVADGDAIIRFEDTGIGLPEGEDLDRLFEPFFTTKEPGKGTGLGLPICRDIVEKYNGTIIPARRRDGGTVFTVRLPLESCTVSESGRLSSAVPAAARSRFGSDPKETTE